MFYQWGKRPTEVKYLSENHVMTKRQSILNANLLTVVAVQHVYLFHSIPWASLVTPAVQETGVWSLGGEDPLEKEMATHTSVLDWKIPWTEEPGGLQSMGSQKSWDMAESTNTCTFTFIPCAKPGSWIQQKGRPVSKEFMSLSKLQDIVKDRVTGIPQSVDHKELDMT